MQRGLYQNKVTSSLAEIQRPCNRADICKMIYWSKNWFVLILSVSLPPPPQSFEVLQIFQWQVQGTVRLCDSGHSLILLISLTITCEYFICIVVYHASFFCTFVTVIKCDIYLSIKFHVITILTNNFVLVTVPSSHLYLCCMCK